ncbi:MAG: GNAT family N-acetyltransferase [Verrucomicrobiales bacterium]|nr:GNAT family N-acetyltransferase [Verrucomicrobiales bacterium]
MGGIEIRPATAADVPLVLGFIRQLAEYERLTHEVVADEAILRESLFGARPAAEALIGTVDGVPAGFVVFFQNFSTFLGRPGLYLEDLFVLPEFRGRGLGKAFLTHLAGEAVRRGCGRFEWAVLDWNQPAIDFYRKLGAEPQGDWTIFRLTGEALRRLAKGATG